MKPSQSWFIALALLTPGFLVAAEPDDDPLPAGAVARLETAGAWNGGVVAVAVLEGADSPAALVAVTWKE